MRTLNKISYLLEEQKKNQKNLTDYLGLSKNIFTDWKSGKCKSYMKHLPKIAEFFDVSVDYLLERETKVDSLILPYSGDERINSIAKEILKADLTDDDLNLIEFILDKYKK